MTPDLNVHLVLDDLRLVETTRIGMTAWSLTHPCWAGGGRPGPGGFAAQALRLSAIIRGARWS
jgi:hypothetical protein